MLLRQEQVHSIVTSEKFQKLVKMRATVSFSLTLLMLIIYFGFILLVAFNKEFLAGKIGEYITIGLPIGIGVIVFAWLLTGVYIWWANNKYDRLVKEFRNQILK